MAESKTQHFHKRTSPRTVKCKFEDFDSLEGALLVRAVMKPIEIGRAAQEIYYEWVESDNFAFSLRANQEFPITLRAHRYPQDIGRRQSKETRKMVEPMNPQTWPLEAQLRGSKMCMNRGYCIHEERGEMVNGVPYKCPRAIDLPSGEIRDGKSLWILRVDGPPCREEELEEVRAEEKIKYAANDRLVKMKLAAKQALPVQVVTEVKREDLHGTPYSVSIGSETPTQ